MCVCVGLNLTGLLINWRLCCALWIARDVEVQSEVFVVRFIQLERQRFILCHDRRRHVVIFQKRTTKGTN